MGSAADKTPRRKGDRFGVGDVGGDALQKGDAKTAFPVTVEGRKKAPLGR